MIEHVVQTISLNFSVVEDRLELRCRAATEAYQLWLTQRMWLQLTPAIVKWLVDSGVGAPHTKGFLDDSFAEHQSVPVELPAPSTSFQPSDENAENNDVLGEEHVSANITTKWVLEPWLCTTVNMQMSDQVIRIRFVSERSQHAFLLSLSTLEACHFLKAQKNALKNSGWGFEWPIWLSESVVPEAPRETSLH